VNGGSRPEDPVRIAFDRPQWTADEVSAQTVALGEDAFRDPVGVLEARLGLIFGRSHALVVPSPSLALYIALSGLGIGSGDEVVASPFSWFRIARAIPWRGANLVVSDIDAWSFTLDPEKAGRRTGPKTRAILVGNALGHPADWDRFEVQARERSLVLIEDATESLFSEYRSRRTGSFGDVSILAFGSPHPNLGEAYGVILTDRPELDTLFRRIRGGSGGKEDVSPDFSLSLGLSVPEGLARLGLLSLSRLPAGLQKRALLLEAYQESMRSFEGVKDLYRSPEADRVNGFSFMVHLGTRFSVLSRNAIVEDLVGAGIGARAFPPPLHLDPWFQKNGYEKGMAPIAEKLADRSIALPFHPGLSADDAENIIERFKEAATQVGAGASIY
jgi:hypothetical protein